MLAQSFGGVAGNFSNVHKLKATNSGGRREPGYSVRALRDEVQSPDTVA